MSDRWPRGWQETASAWKLSSEALLWAYELRRAVQERDFPLFPSPAGWSQFLELEYKQRAWAAGDEGRSYFNACSEIEEMVRRDLVPSLMDIATRISPSALASLREKRHRLLTIPNPNLKLRCTRARGTIRRTWCCLVCASSRSNQCEACCPSGWTRGLPRSASKRRFRGSWRIHSRTPS